VRRQQESEKRMIFDPVRVGRKGKRGWGGSRLPGAGRAKPAENRESKVENGKPRLKSANLRRPARRLPAPPHADFARLNLRAFLLSRFAMEFSSTGRDARSTLPEKTFRLPNDSRVSNRLMSTESPKERSGHV
jgi:hypothetical protein